jgi:chromosomal replication initiator protein
MIHNQRYDIAQANYMALPGLMPGTTFAGVKNANDIIYIVTVMMGVTDAALKSKRRHRFLVEARMMAIYLIRKHTRMSLAHIGALFGGRDHTTAIHSINTAEDLILTDHNFKRQLLMIENKLLS